MSLFRRLLHELFIVLFRKFRLKHSTDLFFDDIQKHVKYRQISIYRSNYEYEGSFTIGMGYTRSGLGDWVEGNYTSDPEIIIMVDRDLNILDFSFGGFYNSNDITIRHINKLKELFCGTYDKLILTDPIIISLVDEFIFKFHGTHNNPNFFYIDLEDIELPAWPEAMGKHNKNLTSPCDNCPFLKSTKPDNFNKDLDLDYYYRFSQNGDREGLKSCTKIVGDQSKNYENELCVGHLAFHAKPNNEGLYIDKDLESVRDQFKKDYKKGLIGFNYNQIKTMDQFDRFYDKIKYD